MVMAAVAVDITMTKTVMMGPMFSFWRGDGAAVNDVWNAGSLFFRCWFGLKFLQLDLLRKTTVAHSVPLSDHPRRKGFDLVSPIMSYVSEVAMVSSSEPVSSENGSIPLALQTAAKAPDAKHLLIHPSVCLSYSPSFTNRLQFKVEEKINKKKWNETK